MDHHVKKVEENLELKQQGKEEDAKVFVGNNTCWKDGLNMVSEMLEGHLEKVAKTAQANAESSNGATWN